MAVIQKTPRARANRRPHAPSARKIAADPGALWRVVRPGMASDPSRTCWACLIVARDGSRALTRAHIDPYCERGGVAPSDYVLLCETCHREQPDGAGRLALLAWMATREHWRERQARLMAPVMHAVRVVAALAGDPGLWDAFAAAIDPRSVIVPEAEGQGAAHLSNVMASLRWALLVRFVEWVRARGGVVDAGAVARVLADAYDATAAPPADEPPPVAQAPGDETPR